MSDASLRISCAYCDIADKQALIFCASSKKWFCNGQGRQLPRSHAVEHFRQGRGSNLCLIPENRWRRYFDKETLECFKCSTINVFELGVVESIGQLKLICRFCQLVSPDKRKWRPIINEGSFILEIAKPFWLSVRRDISQAVVNQLEKNWAQDDDDFDESKFRLPDKKPITYLDRYSYYKIHRNFLELDQKANEAELKKREKEANVKITWEFPSDLPENVVIASFVLRTINNGNRLNTGNTLTLSRQNWSQKATVIRERDGRHYTVILTRTRATPIKEKTGFSIGWAINLIPYRRMQSALLAFSEPGQLPDHIVEAILGEPVLQFQRLTEVRVPGLPRDLNQSQRDAIRYALKRSMAVIEAPPGTGKTTVAAVMAYQLVKNGVFPVLVCAPSNIATDNVASALVSTRLPGIIRMYARWKEKDPKCHAADRKVDAIALHRLAAKYASKKKEYAVVERALLEGASVICCTCMAAGDARLRGIDFEALIVDECTQANECESLVPISRAAQRVILLGDRKQLGPIVHSKKAQKTGFGLSLFERMGQIHGSVSLSVQYRMHPAISAFPSATFYDGRLHDGIGPQDRTLFEDDDELIWPAPEIPIVFISSKRHGDRAEEISSSSTSFLNRNECELVHEMLCRFFHYSIKPKQISVITMYEGQREYLRAYLSNISAEDEEEESWNSDDQDEDGDETWNSDDQEDEDADDNEDDDYGDQESDANYAKECKKVEVNTVDGYQGRENDFVIISCVRSNNKRIVGFLSEPRRINVALTRARYGLVVIGDPDTLATCPTWQSLIDHYKSQGTFLNELPGFD